MLRKNGNIYYLHTSHTKQYFVAGCTCAYLVMYSNEVGFCGNVKSEVVVWNFVRVSSYGKSLRHVHTEKVKEVYRWMHNIHFKYTFFK